MLIDSAVRAVKGNVKDNKALVAAMRKATSSRCAATSSSTTTTIRSRTFYLLKAVKGGPDGVEMKIEQKVFDKHQDSYHQDCKMKW